jgi:hypothetical protein
VLSGSSSDALPSLQNPLIWVVAVADIGAPWTACCAPATKISCRAGQSRAGPSWVEPASFASEHKRFGASPLVSRPASSGGAVGLKLSLGGILGHLAHRPEVLAGAHLPPGLNAPSLNLPFPTHGRSFTYQAQLPHSDPSSSPCCRCGSYSFSFSVDFCEVPPLLSAFAHVPFTQPSFRPCLSAP